MQGRHKRTHECTSTRGAHITAHRQGEHWKANRPERCWEHKATGSPATAGGRAKGCSCLWKRRGMRPSHPVTRRPGGTEAHAAWTPPGPSSSSVAVSIDWGSFTTISKAVHKIKNLPLDYSTKYICTYILSQQSHFWGLTLQRGTRYSCRLTCWCIIMSNHKIHKISAPASEKLIKPTTFPSQGVWRKTGGWRQTMGKSERTDALLSDTRIAGRPVTRSGHR